MTSATDLEQIAAAWIVRIGDPDCTARELAELDAWLAINPTHRRVFQELLSLWYDVDALGCIDLPAILEADGLELEDAGPSHLELTDRETEEALGYIGAIRAYHRRYAPNSEDSQRLVAETYQRVVAGRPFEIAGACSIAQFLLTAAREVAVKWLRQQPVVPIGCLADIEALQTLGPGEQLQRIASADRIVSALSATLNNLPLLCRHVLVLYKKHGYTCAQVALHLDISQRTVKKQLQRAALHFDRALYGHDTTVYGKPALSAAKREVVTAAPRRDDQTAQTG
jgi:RNA polymerase sigma-70 factor (ECF subfamily)